MEEVITVQPAPPGPEQQPEYAPPGHTFRSVTDKISAIVLTRGTRMGWWMLFGFSLLLPNLMIHAHALPAFADH